MQTLKEEYKTLRKTYYNLRKERSRLECLWFEEMMYTPNERDHLLKIKEIRKRVQEALEKMDKFEDENPSVVLEYKGEKKLST